MVSGGMGGKPSSEPKWPCSVTKLSSSSYTCADIHNTVRSRHIAVIFLLITHERYPIVPRQGELWGVGRECKFSLKFHYWNRCDVRVIELYVTAIYRESIVYHIECAEFQFVLILITIRRGSIHQYRTRDVCDSYDRKVRPINIYWSFCKTKFTRVIITT